MQNRFRVDKNGGGSYQVVDSVTDSEFCATGDFEGHEDAGARAERVAKLLNEADRKTKRRKRR
jgi:hypothetical protein